MFAFAERTSWQFDHRHPEGVIGKLNREGHLAGPLPDGVLDTLRLARSIAEASRGAFDPTVLALTSLWSFDTGGRLPSAAELAAALPRVDYTRLSVAEDGTVSLPPGLGLDLGAIAKSAVVDLIAAELDRRGHHSYLVEAGGDILVSGLKKGGDPWSIGIRHPRNAEAMIGVLKLGEGGPVSVVTSGDYERYFQPYVMRLAPAGWKKQQQQADPDAQPYDAEAIYAVSDKESDLSASLLFLYCAISSTAWYHLSSEILKVMAEEPRGTLSGSAHPCRDQRAGGSPQNPAPNRGPHRGPAPRRPPTDGHVSGPAETGRLPSR